MDKDLKIKNREGQVMFLTVVVLGAIISSVTVIAGLLVSLQIRRSADVAASTRAIFAADAGVECMLFEIFKSGKNGTEAQLSCNNDSVMTNGANFEVENSPNNSLVGGVDTGVPRWFRSTGQFSNSVRSVEITLELN